MTKKTVAIFFILLILLSNTAQSYTPTIIDPELTDYLNNISNKLPKASGTITASTQIQSTSTQTMIPAIITLNDPKDKTKIIELLQDNNAEIRHIYDLIDAIAIEIPYDNIENILSNPYIKSIYLDAKVQVPQPDETTEKEIETLKAKGRYTPMLDKSAATTGAPSVWELGINGTGTTIAILDTGIDKTHPGLLGKISKERDFTLYDSKLNTEDGFGHGTHIAGIIAGSGAGSTITADTTSEDTGMFTGIPDPDQPTQTGTIELDSTYNILLTKWTMEYKPGNPVNQNNLPPGWTMQNSIDYLSITQDNKDYTLWIDRDGTKINRISIDNKNTWLTNASSDETKIETSTKKLYLGTADPRTDTLREVKPTLSENDLDMLTNHTITYDDGTTTTMTQSIDLTDNTEIRFSEDDPTGTTTTPRLILYNPAGTSFYNITLAFPEGLDISDPDNTTNPGSGIAEQHITIMDRTYTLGRQADLSTKKMILYAGEEKTLAAGDNPIAFETDGHTHTIRMTSWTGTGPTIKGVFELDGVSYTKAEGTKIPIAGTESKITILDIIETRVPSPDGGPPIEGAMAKIMAGTTEIILKDAEEITKNDNTIPGAIASFTSAGNMIHDIKISYSPDQDIAREENITYTDPVFESFDFILEGMTSNLESASRDKIILAKNGKKIKLTAPMKDGNTISLNIYQSDYTQKFTLKVDDKPFRINATQYDISTAEYMLVSDGEYSNILQYRAIDTANDLLTIRDINSGNDIIIPYDSETLSGTFYIGASYYSITGIDEISSQFDLHAWSGPSQREGSIPIITRNGAMITLMSGIDGTEFSEPAQINISETDTIDKEPENTGTDLIASITTKTISTEIDNIDFTNMPVYFQTINDSNVYRGLTSYGTLIEKDTDADSLTMWYPDHQAYADVYVKKHGPPNPPTEISWGNATIRFNTGLDSYLKIITGYDYAYLDTDANLSTKTDQMTAFENQHFKKHYSLCLSFGCIEITSNSEYILSSIDENRQSITIGIDSDLDGKADIFKGIAPGATLLNAKVVDDNGFGFESDIIAGIEWSVKNNADIISMSLGSSTNICDGNDPLSKATQNAWDMGVTTVIAAGNSGWWNEESITSPGCADKVITVGATTKYLENLEIASFSSVGPTSDGRIKPELLAPGNQIISARAKNTGMSQKLTSYYMPASGTSMSAPHVAAAAALLKQANPHLTPGDIKTYLMNGATDIKEKATRQGAGLLNISKSYELASSSKPVASPPLLNLIIQQGTKKNITFNTSSPVTSISAFDDSGLTTDTVTSTGTVNSTTGFNYTFTIPDEITSADITITWNRTSNDIDMTLYDPQGFPYAGSYGITNRETILLKRPEPGEWRLLVYPFSVSGEENVNISIKRYIPKKLDWFTHDTENSILSIIPGNTPSGLYTGKIKVTSDTGNATIPYSIIISEPKEFRSYESHEQFSNNICNTNPVQGSPSGGGSSSSGGGGSGATPYPSTENSYKTASFDGYFCQSQKRLAYSFEVQEKIPYLKIDTWIRNYNNRDYIRQFIYNPEGKEYAATEVYAGIRSFYIDEPETGNWTIVIQSELYSLTDAGIQFSGTARYPGIIIEPGKIFTAIKAEDTKNMTINITNFLNYGLYINSTGTILWTDTPISISPESEIDQDQAPGPFGYSYRYYNFNIEQEQLTGKTLKSRITASPEKYKNSLLYIFDANGTLVHTDGFSSISDKYNTLHTTLSDTYEPGTWTAVLQAFSLGTKITTFELEMWITEKTTWNGLEMTALPEHPFKGKANMTIAINPEKDIAPGYHYAAIEINGSWQNTTAAPDDAYIGPYFTTIPFTILVTDQMIDLSMNIEKQEFMPNEEIVASATLTNNNNQKYQPVTGSMIWEISHGNETHQISKTDSIQIESNETINMTQNWRPDITTPGDHTLTVYYNYTDQYNQNWQTKKSKTFKVGTSNIAISPGNPANISASGIDLQVDVKDPTNASINILTYTINPSNETPGNNAGAGRFIRIETDSALKNSLNWAILKISYNKTDIQSWNIDENSLMIYYWNESSGNWDLVGGTIDTENNIIYVNITHFSTYGLFGSENAFCGDSVCNNGETCSSCTTDCGQCSGSSSGNSKSATYILPKTQNETKTNNTEKPSIKAPPTPETTVNIQDTKEDNINSIDEDKTPRILKSGPGNEITDDPTGLATLETLKRPESLAMIGILLVSILAGIQLRKRLKKP